MGGTKAWEGVEIAAVTAAGSGGDPKNGRAAWPNDTNAAAEAPASVISAHPTPSKPHPLERAPGAATTLEALRLADWTSAFWKRRIRVCLK